MKQRIEEGELHFVQENVHMNTEESRIWGFFLQDTYWIISVVLDPPPRCHSSYCEQSYFKNNS